MMPKIHHKNEPFIVHWPEDGDKIILKAGKNYVKYSYFHVYKDGRKQLRRVIDWRRAEQEGALKGTLNLPLRHISKRHSLLIAMKSKEYVERRRKAREKSRKGYTPDRAKDSRRRRSVFSDVPDKIKGNYGHRAKKIWTDRQKKILVRLTGMKKHRLGETEINWELLMKHPWVKELPEGYHDDLAGLRRYYWNVARKDRNDPEYVKRHRSDALRWKKSNRKQYRKNQDRGREILKNSVNDFLLSKIGVRK